MGQVFNFSRFYSGATSASEADRRPTGLTPTMEDHKVVELKSWGGTLDPAPTDGSNAEGQVEARMNVVGEDGDVDGGTEPFIEVGKWRRTILGDGASKSADSISDDHQSLDRAMGGVWAAPYLTLFTSISDALDASNTREIRIWVEVEYHDVPFETFLYLWEYLDEAQGSPQREYPHVTVDDLDRLDDLPGVNDL